MLTIEKDRLQIQCNIVLAYIHFIEEQFPEPTPESEQFLAILRIYYWQQCHTASGKAYDFDGLMKLKHGVRTIDSFFDDFLATEPTGEVEAMAALVWDIGYELAADIRATEACYPELQFAFDREREQYRKMKDDAEQA